MCKKLLPFLALFLLSYIVNAQSKVPSDSLKTSQAKKTEIKELDTNESLKYLSSKLWFQMKKRLHLTTKEEEEAELKKQEKVSLTFGSLKVER
ncbi:MAG: hypothetical protein DWP98_12980 [Bacteroidetes bacterium]|nr:MAG: hypothetical protein DWP98_12980 [Bacteroidota bacterium]MBL1144613.1 hypothetical protein [Bacteroidota bacterium]NOG57408.1 hypothetical protein [Bacteroidota bacterium]